MARKSTSAPTAYDRYLYRIQPDGSMDPLYANGVLLGRNSESGLDSYSTPFEVADVVSFHKFFTNGSVERYTLDPGDESSVLTGSLSGLPSSVPWYAEPTWDLRTLDGRLFVVKKPDNSSPPSLVVVDRSFSSVSASLLPSVYPGQPDPILALQPDRLTLPDFLLRKLHSYNAGSYTSTWLRLEGDTDSDGDGIADFAETGSGTYVDASDTGTSPTEADSDGDGLTDFAEIVTHRSNPNLVDSDGDGFTDFYEVTTGYSPTDATSQPATLLRAVPAVELRMATRIGALYRIETTNDLETWDDTGIQIEGDGNEVRDLFMRVDQKGKYWRAVEIIE